MEKSSSSPIANLAELQQLDRVRREKQIQIQVLEAENAAIDADVDKRQRDFATARDALQQAESRRRELELHLETEGTKMTDRRMRLNRVRNEKELQALRHEIEVGKELNQQVEDEVLQLMEKIDTLTAECGTAEAALTEGGSDCAQRKQNNLEQLVTLRDEIEQMVDGRKRVADSLERSLLQKYEMIFERRAGLAVVEVRNGICLGCRMSVPPQFFNEMQKNPDVRLCPSCHRILYWRPEPVEKAV